MTDYKSVWVKWIAFLNMDLKFRKNFLESLHVEVTRGFDVVAKIGIEEIEANFDDKKMLGEIKSDVERILSVSVWAGYSLFLIHKGIDPEEKNLVASKKTNKLGQVWMENYERDQNKSLLTKIDPFISILIEKQTDLQMNMLFLNFPKIQRGPYFQISNIATYANWAAHQGYIFGMIEAELNNYA